MEDGALERKLSELRDSFDRTFSEPARKPEEALETFLAVRVGGVPYALRLREISGVVVDRSATKLPSPLPELIGLTGVRGRLVPVYSLAAMLGAAAAGVASRWLVLLEREELALAVEHMDGYVFGRQDQILPSGGNQGRHCPRTLRLEASSLGILSVPSIVDRITSRVASTRPRQEQ